jgi:hypothetical protein
MTLLIRVAIVIMVFFGTYVLSRIMLLVLPSGDLGFVGPMIFAPSANQGPMLGIFITGPGGALLGGLAGFFYGLNRDRGR